MLIAKRTCVIKSRWKWLTAEAVAAVACNTRHYIVCFVRFKNTRACLMCLCTTVFRITLWNTCFAYSLLFSFVLFAVLISGENCRHRSVRSKSVRSIARRMYVESSYKYTMLVQSTQHCISCAVGALAFLFFYGQIKEWISSVSLPPAPPVHSPFFSERILFDRDCHE